MSSLNKLSHAQRRRRYWSALALIRCVMSLPAAAIATLNHQVSKSGDAFSFKDATANGNPNRERLLGDLDEDLMSSYVHDPTEQEQAVDASPTVVIEQGQQSYKNADKRKLKAFVQAAERLRGDKDQKLQSCIATVESLLKYENYINCASNRRKFTSSRYDCPNARRQYQRAITRRLWF